MSLKNTKVGFIGCGNLAQAILKSVLVNNIMSKDQFAFTNRSEAKANKIKSDFGISSYDSNDELIDSSDIVIIAVKPQDFLEAVEPFVSNFRPEQIVVSLAAGVDFKSLQALVTTTPRLVRVMTNTPASVSKGVVGYYHSREDGPLDSTIEYIFGSLGRVYPLKDEDEFAAFTVAVCSGVGFIFEIMSYWSEWMEQYGISRLAAENMILDTFKGTVLLAEQNSDMSLTQLQDKVVSKKGVTQAGLDAMNEMELERLFRVSFEKAVMRDKELAKFISP